MDEPVEPAVPAEPARPFSGVASDRLGRLALALVGAVALTAERADELADSLASRGGMSRDEVRGWIDDATTRWRGDAVRVGEKAGATLHGALRELGLVTREEWDDLELRVAQLEHRLRLVETQPSRPVAVPRD